MSTDVDELQKQLLAKDGQLQEALLQIRGLSDALTESRKATLTMSHTIASLEQLKQKYESQLGLTETAQATEEDCGESKDKEIMRLRAILSSHGISADEATANVAASDTKVTQLVAQILNVPASALTPSLVEPLLTAVNSDSGSIGMNDIESFLRQKAAATIGRSAKPAAVEEASDDVVAMEE